MFSLYILNPISMEFLQLVLLVGILLIQESYCQLSRNKDELLNWCLKGINHKEIPGKENSLHQQCEHWSDHSCCIESVSRDIHEINMYNFTFDHCYSRVKQNMSEQCKKHFIQDNCFYECEPHIGLWVVKTTRKMASERFYNVPLCASECNAWFEDCKDDFTCAYNWPRDFKFKKGQNICPENSKCLTFKDTYKNAKDFCENVWDHSWKYSEDEEHCMHIFLDGSSENINKKTAEYYIDRFFSESMANTYSLSSILLTFSIILAIRWKNNLLH